LRCRVNAARGKPRTRYYGMRNSHPSTEPSAAALRPTATAAIGDLTRKNIEIIAELENAANEQRSLTDRIADVISDFVGSMKFVYLHVLWFGLWIAFNTLPIFPKQWRIDAFPFTFLTFVVSLEAIFLSTFILISQNHEERLARRRNHLDLQINLLSEQENSQILKLLQMITAHLQLSDDPNTQALKEAVRPEEMVSQIEDVIEDTDKQKHTKV
jgi:uncharacterized membrane protein